MAEYYKTSGLIDIDLSQVADRIDALLFDGHSMSILSDGFRKFYIYKHTKFDDY